MKIRRRPRLPDFRAQIEEAAVADVVDNHLEGASVASICLRAGLSEEEFHRHFADLEDCVFQVFLRFRDEMLTRLLTAFAQEQSWRGQIRAVYWAMLDHFEEDRRRGRFMAVEALRVSDRASLVFDQFVEVMVELIDQGRQEMDEPERLTAATAEGIAGGISRKIKAAIGEDMPDGEVVGRELMFNVVAPYLGVEAAVEELTIERPRHGIPLAQGAPS